MKKFIATFLCAILLIGAFSVTSFAASDIKFSVSGAEGTPGDIVEVKVFLDENPGTWSAKFVTHFNDKYFTLISVKNGEVFTDGESTKGLLTNKGFYIHYAQKSDPNLNNENTGLFITLTFEIASTCPNGNHEIYLSFPDDGKGWFIDATEYPDFDTDFNITASTDYITVTGSDYETDASETTNLDTDVVFDTTVPADSETQSVDTGSSDSDTLDTDTEDTEVKDTNSKDTDSKDTNSKDTDSKDTVSKDTDSKDTNSKDTDSKDTDSKDTGSKDTNSNDENDDTTAPVPGIPVTEVVTDEAGEAVKDEEGEVVTTEVVDSDGNQIYYETDEIGGIVTDADGGEVTFAETTADPEDEKETTDKPADETTGVDGADTEKKDPSDSDDKKDDEKDSNKKGLSVQQIILIAAVVAVVVGAAVIVVVVTKGKKEDAPEDANGANEDDNNNDNKTEE